MDVFSCLPGKRDQPPSINEVHHSVGLEKDYIRRSRELSVCSQLLQLSSEVKHREKLKCGSCGVFGRTVQSLKR